MTDPNIAARVNYSQFISDKADVKVLVEHLQHMGRSRRVKDGRSAGGPMDELLSIIRLKQFFTQTADIDREARRGDSRWDSGKINWAGESLDKRRYCSALLKERINFRYTPANQLLITGAVRAE